MICYERDYHDSSSNFDDRIELEVYTLSMENEDSLGFRDDVEFYRHLDEY